MQIIQSIQIFKRPYNSEKVSGTFQQKKALASGTSDPQRVKSKYQNISVIFDHAKTDGLHFTSTHDSSIFYSVIIFILSTTCSCTTT